MTGMDCNDVTIKMVLTGDMHPHGPILRLLRSCMTHLSGVGSSFIISCCLNV